MKNRLNLDFQISSFEERYKFLDSYLQTPKFREKPPTPEEIETISNYLLWGQDKNGEPVGKDLHLKSKNGTWDKERKIESIEELSEQINFNENSFYRFDDKSVKPKIKKEVFSREEAVREAPPSILLHLRRLWRHIDETDLLINFYERLNKKKTGPIRESLITKFHPREQKRLYKMAKELEPYIYLKKKHLLVELRREQFTVRDSYRSVLNPRSTYGAPPPKKDFFFPKVFPFGLFEEGREDFFRRAPSPKGTPEKTLRKISKVFWEEKELRQKSLQEELNSLAFDFRKPEDVYQLVQFYEEIQDENLKNLEETELNGDLGSLLKTLNFYIDLAELTESQKIILERKIKKVPNEKIRNEINEKFQRSYTTNYISTIYKQKIIRKINEAAFFHEQILENFPFPENFKKCSCCGRPFLIDSRNFVRKRTSRDGFNSRCKYCDRDRREEKRRERKKEEKKKEEKEN